MTASLSALLVTYAWPPTGGVGVQRVLKLAKYLPQFDVTPTVLTVANPSVPLVDESLMRDVPPGLEVLRARTFEPGYALKQAAWKSSRSGFASGNWKHRVKRGLTSFARQALIPDPQVLWQPDAQRVLMRRLLTKRDDIVFITAPPFSMFLSAPLVRTLGRAAIVLDYRDEWATLRTQYEMLPRMGAAVSAAMEHGVLRCAHAVTVATDAFRDQLLHCFPFLDPARVVTIPNGYDPDDVPTDLLASTRLPDDRFVITYAGTVFTLTSARGLMGALRRLHEREPDLARSLTVRFIGRIVDTELDAFEGSEALGVERLGFCEKDQVAPALASSHMVLCLLDDVPGAARIFPAKTFELMHLGRPCLTLAPPGVLADLVRTHQLGPIVGPRDEQAIVDELITALRAWKDGTFALRSNAVGIERYHRQNVAAQFAELFRTVQRKDPTVTTGVSAVGILDAVSATHRSRPDES